MLTRKKELLAACLAAIGVLIGCLDVRAQEKPAARGQLDRTVLPIPEPKIPHSTVFDARNATPPPRFEVKAPAAAPNVLIVLKP